MKLIVFLLVALSALPARALDFHIGNEALHLDISETLLGAYNGDLGGMVISRDRSDPVGTVTHPERLFYDIISKFNAALQWRRFRLSTRFDTALWFGNPGGLCGSQKLFCQTYFQPEKLSLEYNGRKIQATLGDFYVSFGRGIALSIRKVDEVGIDTTLLGGRLAFHAGNTAGIFVVGASNIQNMDQATGRSAPDPYDLVSGARIEQRLFDRLILGLHVTGGLQRNQASLVPQKHQDGIFHYGGTIDAPRLTNWLSLYFEGDGQWQEVTDKVHQAYALYGSLTAHRGPIAVMLEVKHYSQFQRWVASFAGGTPAEFGAVQYNQPPTAERLVTELVATSYDVTGPRLRIDYRVRDWLVLFASDAFFDDRSIKLYYHDPYAGFELRWNDGASHFFPSGGYRIEMCRANDGSPNCKALAGDFQHIGHAEWDFAQALPHGTSIESQGFILIRRGDNVAVDSAYPQWTEGNAYLAFKWTPWLIFTAGYEWSTRPSNNVNQNFFNGAVQWNFTTASSVRLFVGGQRGGLKCVSGVCRNFPSFTGAQLELVVRL